LQQHYDDGPDRAAVARDKPKGTQHFLPRHINLWIGCLACNATFGLIGAGPRQFILFNILILLAFSARCFQDAPPRSAESHEAPAAGWRPRIRYLMDLLVVCYAMTVFIDNLGGGIDLARHITLNGKNMLNSGTALLWVVGMPPSE